MLAGSMCGGCEGIAGRWCHPRAVSLQPPERIHFLYQIKILCGKAPSLNKPLKDMSIESYDALKEDCK
jgi:hypothetical protein